MKAIIVTFKQATADDSTGGCLVSAAGETHRGT